ncbi:titin-like [Asbolus verrucosus]|uniref:Titin-like n=1 Tax=Asbolus verrucosus TaxID=1661398 RepID=A0A482W2F8_ASBVE|nr:titin-like [Asbolus verrucosus]
MEAEPIILPDNTIIDTSIPPPGYSFPKPDFSAVVSDDTSEFTPADKSEGPLTKPTFKSALQAKKRLQAFSTSRPGSLPSSPLAKKLKPNLGAEDKNEEAAPVAKKAPKKGNYHDDKAKAVIEEIEELKREELQRFTQRKSRSKSRSRSRSRSPDKERFKKVDKKARNYRKRSPTPEKPKKVHKKPKKYPRNWREFAEFDSSFNLNRDFEIASPKGNNELLRQILFESPSLPITQFKMKTVKNEEKIVPFEYISVNSVAIKEKFLPRKIILDTLPKDVVTNIENLYSSSLKFKLDSNVKIKARTWFPKVWRDSENECKLLEKSVGLSFLQTYTGEEEENDFVEGEESRAEEKQGLVEVPKTETKAPKTDKDDSKKKKKYKKNETKTVEEQPEEKPESSAEKKKKKKHGSKEKKKHDANAAEISAKKKKHKKYKLKKKEKRSKEKKVKHKKATKEKRKKDKSHQEEEKPAEKPEKSSKQQVIEELKKIEEKLAKKREQQDKNKSEKKAEKEEKHEKEKSRKRKHSERDDSAKRAKHEKHKKETDNSNSEIKTENTSKKKIEKEKRVDVADVKLEEYSPKKVEKPEKHKPKIEDTVKKSDKKSKSFEEVTNKVRTKKSRWSEPVIKKEEIEFPPKLDIEEEIKRIDEVIKKHEDINRGEEIPQVEEVEKNEEVKERTPDTDEYHSHWESDDEVSSSVRRQSLKLNRSWESDEELFERTYNRNKTQSQSYADLEIPLNIKNFSRRTKWDEKPSSYIDTINEFKLLEEERRNLSEERRKLEIEKQRILKLQEETKSDTEEKKAPAVEEPKKVVRMRSSTPEVDPVKIKKEKCDVLDFNIDSLNSSLLSNVSSTESNFPIAVLENEYEEFIKAVSSETPIQTKKKAERRSSKDSSSSSSSSDSDHKKKKRKKKKKKKKKMRDCEGLLLGKGNNIFNEFDIPVPSDLPEMVPTPVPVPSPIETILPLTPSLLLNPMIDVRDKSVEEPKDLGIDLTKPFVFSSIVLPSKKPPLVDNSNLNLNDDSDSADFTDKFVKKVEEKEMKKVEEKEAELVEETVEKEAEEEAAEKVEVTKTEEIPEPEKIEEEKIAAIPEPAEKKAIEALREEPKKAQPPREADKEPLAVEQETKSRGDSEIKIKRSISPERKHARDKKRSRTRSRDRDIRRRSPPRRRELSPPRRRYSSPRRRSPPRRRGSPRRRSPSPRRRLSPPRRRRRSPSLSPPRSRSGGRKRTPSPRIRRASPLNSPLDGFKRSVADSTISDDMLPQPNPEDYVESPPSYGAKYYDRKLKRSSISPQNSPRRISLDDRINQVLGLEKNEPPHPKPVETYPNYSYNHAYNQYNQYTQYNQFGAQKNDYVTPPYGPTIFTQPPPPIVKPPPTKVVQVGNILQVVPNEEISQAVVEPKPPETSQKIVQVGNMLQIVPAVIPPSKPPVLEPTPAPKPVQLPEKQSAEAIMKQKVAERKAEREKRRQERERRRKEKEKKRKEKEKRKQMKLKIKTENMIKRAIQLEAEALASEGLEEDGENPELPVQWPPISVVVSTTPSCKGILLGEGGSRRRKSVQFADGVRPGEGTSPSGGEELSSPPPNPPKLPKEKRYKKLKTPKKSKKKKIKVKVVKKKVQNLEDGDDDDEDDNLPPPSPPPGSPPPHVFPSRVKTHTINNVHQYVGNIIQSGAAGFQFRPPMPVVLNRHQPPPGYMQGTFHSGENRGCCENTFLISIFRSKQSFTSTLPRCVIPSLNEASRR